MSDPGFTRSDLCSIHGAVGQAEFADAVRGLPGADGYLLIDDDSLAPLAHDVACTLIEAGVLRALGRSDRQRGTRGTWPVTSCCGQRTGAGR